ncbi:sensor histidine kinase [Buchananella hordeovulneris]|uniref:sensor histidine kinase n=1 Tax=Buchananella hordeovulneris TaxID=52770 RepID=UPI0026DD937B|nr:HAMP domain-containing sensor histidine kinase [Buchananella hordeovulneris]
MLTIALVASFAALVSLTRSWMLWQLDAAIRDDIQRMVSNYSSGASVPGTAPPPTIPGAGQVPPTLSPPELLQDPAESADFSPVASPVPSLGTLFLVRDATGTSGGLIQHFHIHELPSSAVTSLAGLSAVSVPQNVEVPELGAFRVHVRDVGGVRFVAARGLGDVNDVVIASTCAGLGVLLLALVAATLIARRWVRRELRPLEEVVQVARRVGSDVLDSTSQTKLRVDTTKLQDGSEVGDVGFALNALLDDVNTAMDARDQSERRLRQFVADASHELRTPLASIQGYAQLMETSGVDQARALERISSESVRMRELIEDLLLLARLDADKQAEHVPVDLIPLAIDSVSDAHAVCPSKSWRIEVDPADAERCVIAGDQAALRQVLANLLSNARAHTPSGTQVILEMAKVGDEVIVQVSDDGPGIDPALLPRIFDRFVKGDSSRARAGGGSSGLGLAIVQAIVHAHGGQIGVESASTGTTFRLSFPALRQDHS